MSLVLSRTVRFCLTAGVDPSTAPSTNGYGGAPGPIGIGAYYEIDVACEGQADPVSGYVVDIGDIDGAVREGALPVILAALERDPAQSPARLLPELLNAVRARLNRPVRSLTWRLTPFHHVRIEAQRMEQAIITHSYDFAAAHRLQCDELSDAENSRLFGKCNNLNGHGHNYRLDVSVAVPLGTDAPIAVPGRLDDLVETAVLCAFDHRHLNLDTADFAATNPTVEHIAQACHRRLEAGIAAAGGRLDRVRVWETDRTWCEFPG